MLFLVIAYDGTDAEAPERRQRVRGRHLEAARERFEAGVIQYAGAMTDDDGGMIGSMLVVEAADRAAVKALVDADAYTSGDVWQRVEIHPFRRAF